MWQPTEREAAQLAAEESDISRIMRSGALDPNYPAADQPEELSTAAKGWQLQVRTLSPRSQGSAAMKGVAISLSSVRGGAYDNQSCYRIAIFPKLVDCRQSIAV